VTTRAAGHETAPASNVAAADRRDSQPLAGGSGKMGGKAGDMI